MATASSGSSSKSSSSANSSSKSSSSSNSSSKSSSSNSQASSGGWGSGGYASNNSSSKSSSGGWGSSSYASNNSSQMSGGYQSNGGSSSGSGGSARSGFSGTSQPSVSAKSASKTASQRSAPSLATGQPALTAATATTKDNASAPTVGFDAWSRNTAYTDGLAGRFGTSEHVATLNDAAKNKTMTEGQIATARAMVAGKQAAAGQKVAGGLLGVAGTAVAGPVGGMVAKGVSWAGGKLSDMFSGYNDNPAYAQSKQLANGETSIVGKAIGALAPKGLGAIGEVAYTDATGNYNAAINGLNKSMIAGGYTKAPTNAPQISSGSSSQPSLLSNMLSQQQKNATQPADDYSPGATNWGNFSTSYGSVI